MSTSHDAHPDLHGHDHLPEPRTGSVGIPRSGDFDPVAFERAVGDLLRAGLRELAKEYPVIGDVRGAGLFIGAEFVKDPLTKEPHEELAMQVVNKLRDHNVLISASSPLGNVLKIRPPLPFTADNAAYFLDILADVMAELGKTTGVRG